MSTITIVILATLTYSIPIALMVLITLGWRRVFERDQRRSPLTSQQIHLPGEQLRQRLEKLDEDYSAIFVSVSVGGPVLAISWLLLRMKNVDWSSMSFGTGDYLLASFAIVLPAVGAGFVVRYGRQRRRVKQGLAAEVATAQLLVPLQAEGCQIFHDLPCPGFNIDHVVVAPYAVFAVETKSRLKPGTRGKESARVRFDGSRLIFPTHVETKPLDQARHQARWLSQHLSGATGETVKVVPALALPGWYVELTKEGSRADVTVFNPKNPRFMTHPAFGTAIEPAQGRRIAHALTQLYPVPKD